MTSTTEPLDAHPATEVGERRFPGANAKLMGAVLCVIGFGLVCWPSLLAGALGLETLAAAFWWWARVAEDRAEQIPRWTWIRRPALALWLACAFEALAATLPPGVLAGPGNLSPLITWTEALAVAWAGLELLAALPLARLFSDRPGPAIGPWLPVLLPAAGFLVLWRHVAQWTSVPPVRNAVLVLVLVTALLASLRAFGRLRIVASLRWLAVADCALAAALVAMREVSLEVSMLLWLGACGGRAALLAGELRGSAPRRSPAASRLWRASGWTASAALSWPLIQALGFGHPRLAHPAWAVVAGVATALVAWTVVRRTVNLPERRAVVRREPAIPVTQLAATMTLVAGPVALLVAWWTGFEASWPTSILALAPALIGGLLAWLRNRRGVVRLESWVENAGPRLRALARGTFHGVVTLEQRLVRLVARIGLALIAPTRDLHTGDAQEYLLFLVGLTVLALVLPLLG